MSSRYLKVEGQNGLVRDPNTGVIININKEEIQKAREAKAKRRKQKSEFQQLRQDVDELKGLLNKIVEKL